MLAIEDENYIAPEPLTIFRDESQNLCVEIQGRGAWRKVVAKLAFPYSAPESFVLLMQNDEPIGMVRSLSELDEDSRAVLQEALRKRYHIPEIQCIVSVHEAHNAAMWVVETDRGPRDLLVRDRHNFRRIKDGDLIIVDVDGNRFRVSRHRVFDKESQKLLDLYS
ncbi:MAG: DUF1854 domain-containing protein [Candidatus Brocadiae bacterium]|nr:DUF1854 domain-containing protein [Candidatus Brocadiia bacterium]